MLYILDRISHGEGSLGDLKKLEDLAQLLAGTALCALGKTAANPVLSTLRYFREEYETHISRKKCPAGVCKALIEYSIDPGACTGCGTCKRGCAHKAITGSKKKPHKINLKLCRKCGICKSECKFDAIIVH